MTPIPATPPAAATPPATPPPAMTAEEVAALRREVADLKTASSESQRTAQFWYEKANKAGEPKPPAAAVEPEEDVLDLITSKGAKGLDELLKKRGYVREADVDGKIETRANQLVREAALVKEYPELDDKKSEFFLATAKHYGALVKNGVPAGEAMELAAERTELEMIRAGTRKTPAQKTADAAAQRLEERRLRAEAQSGDRGGPRGGGEEDDDTPTADELGAIRRLADALEIPMDKATERYKARARKGVNVAVKIGR